MRQLLTLFSSSYLLFNLDTDTQLTFLYNLFKELKNIIEFGNVIVDTVYIFKFLKN